MNRTDVEKLAKLARIDVSHDEVDRLLLSFDSILEFVSHVQEISSKEVEVSLVGGYYNVMRDDEKPHESGIYSKEILNSSPEREGDFVKVKKIL